MASRTHRAQLEVLVLDEDEVVAEAAATDEFDRLGRSTWATVTTRWRLSPEMSAITNLYAGVPVTDLDA
jgi:hypothetical protein